MTKRRNDMATPQKGSSAAEQGRKLYKRHLDERLDEALKETFPASDPIAVTPRREQAG